MSSRGTQATRAGPPLSLWLLVLVEAAASAPSTVSFGDSRWGGELCHITSAVGAAGQRTLSSECEFTSADVAARDARITSLETMVAELTTRLTQLEAKAITTPNAPPAPPITPPSPPSVPPTPPVPPGVPPPPPRAPPSVPSTPSSPPPNPPLVAIDKGFTAAYGNEVSANGFATISRVTASSTETLYVAGRLVWRIHWPIVHVSEGYLALHAGGGNYNGVRSCNAICESLNFQGVDPGYGRVERVPDTSRTDPYGPYQSQWCNAGCGFLRDNSWNYNYAGWNMCDNCPNKMAWCDCTDDGSKTDHEYWQGCCANTG